MLKASCPRRNAFHAGFIVIPSSCVSQILETASMQAEQLEVLISELATEEKRLVIEQKRVSF